MRQAAPPPRVPDRLETERLELLRPHPEDLDELASLLGDDQVGEWLGEVFDRERAQAALVRDIGHWETHHFGLWIMRDRESGALLGRGGLHHTIVGGAAEVEVGWAVARERWGQGIATEMAHAALAVARDRLELDEVVSLALPDNLASLRVMEKIGLRFDREVVHRGLPHVVYRGPTGRSRD